MKRVLGMLAVAALLCTSMQPVAAAATVRPETPQATPTLVSAINVDKVDTGSDYGLLAVHHGPAWSRAAVVWR